METKQDIRKQMLCARDRLTESERETYSDRITRRVVSHPLFEQAEEIWCYVSFQTEVCTDQILRAARKAGKKTAVPKVTGKRKMEFYYIESLDEDVYKRQAESAKARFSAFFAATSSE